MGPTSGPSTLKAVSLGADCGRMDINCPNCGQVLNVISRQPLQFATREANAIDPPRFIVVESGAAGDWLLHSCDATTAVRDARPAC